MGWLLLGSVGDMAGKAGGGVGAFQGCVGTSPVPGVKRSSIAQGRDV